MVERISADVVSGPGAIFRPLGGNHHLLERKAVFAHLEGELVNVAFYLESQFIIDVAQKTCFQIVSSRLDTADGEGSFGVGNSPEFVNIDNDSFERFPALRIHDTTAYGNAFRLGTESHRVHKSERKDKYFQAPS